MTAAPSPFEEPAKTEMRDRCEVAIDQAGHHLVATMISYASPATSGLKGNIRGDLQSLDGADNRYCYYLRPKADEALPKWLVNFGRIARQFEALKLYVVAIDTSSAFEKSCRAAGIGLLALTDDDRFDSVIDFDLVVPVEVAEAHRVEVDAIRRDLETKLALGQSRLKGKLERVGEILADVSEEVSQKYITSLEVQYKAWEHWAQQASARLDLAATKYDAAELTALRALVDAGPDLASDG